MKCKLLNAMLHATELVKTAKPYRDAGASRERILFTIHCGLRQGRCSNCCCLPLVPTPCPCKPHH